MSRRTLLSRRTATASVVADQATLPRAVSIRINLLPHREAARERRKREFMSMLGVVALAGLAAVFAGGLVITQSIDVQRERNQFVRDENKRLDRQIAEIRTLREDIAALRARQKAVEDLQSERTLPVHLFDELLKTAPEGLHLRTLKQDDRRVTLSGHAQTNERVAELLRNLSERSPWLERPELGEIKEVELKPVAGQKDKDVRKVYEFTLNALIRPTTTNADPAARSTPPTTSTEPIRLGSVR
jgi:type IV pilus assembly protein PilN